MRKLSFLLFGALLLSASCSNGDDRCNNMTGTTAFCIDGVYFEPTLSNWSQFMSNSVIIYLGQSDGTYPEASLYITLYNTAGNDVPETGTYSVFTTTTSPDGTRKCQVTGSYNPDATSISVAADESATNTFELTSYDSGTGKVSGFFEGTLKNFNNASQKFPVKIYFTNI